MSNPHCKNWLNLLPYPLLLIAVGLAQLRKTPIFLRSGIDGGIFSYIGTRILVGDIPYIDVWDHKPPLTYYLNAGAQWLLGTSPWATWLLSFAWIIMCTLLLYAALRKPLGNWIAFFSTLMFALTLHHPSIYQAGNFTEIYALLPQILCLASTFAFLRSRRKVWALLLGLATSAALLTRIPSIGPALAGLAVIILHELILSPHLRERAQSLILSLGAWLSGLLLPLALTALYWHNQGGLQAFWSAVVEFNFLYIQGGFSLRGVYAVMRNLVLSQPLSTLSTLTFVNIALYGIDLIQRIGHTRTSTNTFTDAFHHWSSTLDDAEWVFLAGLLLLPIDIVFIALSGRNYGHYYLSILPAFALHSAGFLKHLTSSRRTGARLSPQQISTLALTTFVLLAWLLDIFGWVIPDSEHLRAIDRIGEMDGLVMEEIDRFVLESTQPDEYVLAWGYELRINVLTGRPTPSKYIYAYPLLVESGMDEEEFNRFFEDIGRHPPAIILFRQGDALAKHILRLDPPPCQDCSDVIEMNLRDFANQIRNHYTQMNSPESWYAFRRITR